MKIVKETLKKMTMATGIVAMLQSGLILENEGKAMMKEEYEQSKAIFPKKFVNNLLNDEWDDRYLQEVSKMLFSDELLRETEAQHTTVSEHEKNAIFDKIKGLKTGAGFNAGKMTSERVIKIATFMEEIMTKTNLITVDRLNFCEGVVNYLIWLVK